MSKRRHRNRPPALPAFLVEAWIRAVKAMDQDKLLDLVNEMPVAARRRMLGHVGAPAAPKAKPAMIKRVVSHLHTAQGSLSDPVVAAVAAPLAAALDNREMSAETWRTLLGPDDLAAGMELLRHDDMAELLGWVGHLDPSLVRVMAVACTGLDGYGTVVALRVLGGLDEHSEKMLALAGELDAKIALIEDGHTLDVESLLAVSTPEDVEPLLPVDLPRVTPAGRANALGAQIVGRRDVPAVLRVLASAVDEKAGDDLTTDLEHVEAELIGQEQNLLDAQVADVDGQVEELVGQGGLVRLAGDAWDTITEIATKLATDLAEGRIPRVSAARMVMAFTINARRAATALGVADRAGLAEQARAWKDGAFVAPERRWLLRLANVTGPDSLSPDLARVADLAKQTATGEQSGPEDGLRGLLDLIVARARATAGEPVDAEHLMAAQEAATTGLPGMDKVVFAAGAGLLTVPDAEDTSGRGDTPSGGVGQPSALNEPAEQPAGAEPVSSTSEPQSDPTHGTGRAADTPVGIVDTGDGSRADLEDDTPTVEPASQAAQAQDQTQAHVEHEFEADRELDGELAAGQEPHGQPSDDTAGQGDGGHAAVEELDLSELSLAPSLAKFLPAAHATAPTPQVEDTTDVDAEKNHQEEAAPDYSWGSAAHTTLDAALIGQGRYGLACDLATAAGAPDASIAARRLGAYAADLTDRTGVMATEFSRRAALVTRETLADDRTGQLLAWAAAAKACVLAPFAGAAEILTSLEPCVSSHPALTGIGEVLVQWAHSGAAFVPDTAQVAGASADAHSHARACATKANELLDRAPTRTLNYLPAGDVYRAWLAPGGPLGQVIRAVADNDPDQVDQVRADVLGHLRGGGDRAVDTTFTELKGKAPRGYQKITAGPRVKLIGMWDEVVDLANDWVSAREKITAQEEAAQSQWAAAAVHRLRTQLTAHRATALDDLTELLTQAGVTGPDTPAPVLLLNQALVAFDGKVPTGSEPPAAFAEHAELLSTDLDLDPATLAPTTEWDIHELVKVASRPVPSLEDLYTDLAGRGAHDLTKVVVTAAEATDPDLGARLRTTRAQDLATWDTRARQVLANLAEQIDVRRADGVLTDQTWARATARTEALSATGRHDYARILTQAGELTAEADAERDRLIDAAVAELEAAADVTGEHTDALIGLARDGQVTAALEGLQQAREGHPVLITTGTQPPSHLSRFFPDVPQVLTRTGGRVLEMVGAALRDGSHNQVTKDLAQVGLDLLELPGPRRKQALEAVDAWLGLAVRRPKSAMSPMDMLRMVLRQAGITFKTTTNQPSPEGQVRVRLREVDLLGTALTPVLGSGRSPGSDTLDVLVVRKAPTPASVVESLATSPRDRTVVVLWLGQDPLTPDQWRGIAEVSRGQADTAPPVLVIDAAVLVYLAGQAEPRARTLEQVTLAFTSTNPYRVTSGDVAPEMFYGRVTETAQIIDRDGSSFVCGGRQLGKSALLRHAARTFRRASDDHVAIVLSVYSAGKDNTPPEVIWSSLWPELVTAGVVDGPVPDTDVAQAVFTGVRTWVDTNPARRLLLLLDEADDFLDADAAGGRFANVEWLRRLMVDTGRAVKVVLAGLHSTARFESLPNQPLSHLGRPVVVGPLAPSNARALLTEPLAALGYEFDSPATVARVLAQANNMPAQVQLIGSELADHMASKPVTDGPPLLITTDDVTAAFTPRLNARLREMFTLTLALDPRYRVIALNVALAAYEDPDASLTLVDLEARCHQTWPEGFAGVGKDAMRGLVTECVDLGVLARDGSRYRLRTPAVRRLLGTEEEVFDELAYAAENLTVPEVDDGAVFRRGITARGVVSPLTERQLGVLLGPGSGVVVVAGSQASGLDRVVATLEEVAPSTPAAGNVVRVSQPRGTNVAHEVSRSASRTRVLVDARTLGHDKVVELVADAHAAVQATKAEVTVVIACGPASAGAWAGMDHVVQLERVGLDGMRLLSGADLVPLHDPRSQERVVTDLGGWWQLVTRVQEVLADHGHLAAGGEVIDQVAGELTGSPGRLATAAGLVPGSALGRAFALAVDMAGSATPADWAALLAEDPDLVGAMGTDGFTSTREVVSALLTLGVLTAGKDGLVGPEPVVAADYTAAVQVVS